LLLKPRRPAGRGRCCRRVCRQPGAAAGTPGRHPGHPGRSPAQRMRPSSLLWAGSGTWRHSSRQLG